MTMKEMIFDGRMTVGQLLAIVAGVVLVLLLLKILKKTFRWVAIVAAFIWFTVSYGLLSPEQLEDVGAKIYENGIGSYQKFADASSHIELAHDKVRILLGDTWYDVGDLKSWVKSANGVVDILTPDGSVSIEDETVVRLLESFK